MAISNPVEWGVQRLGAAANATGTVGRGVLETETAPPRPLTAPRHITTADLRDALARGWDDFAANRTDVIMLCVFYPLLGLIFGRLASGHELMPLIFPLASGFALVGPLAGVGLYEMSRRRERGEPVSWATPFAVLNAPSFGAILMLGVVLVGLLGLWLLAANTIYAATLGPDAPQSLSAFAHDVFATSRGWAMILVGMGVGFVFALVVLAIATVSFPMLLDRRIGMEAAVWSSVRALLANPRTMAIWGLIVAVLLVAGSIPLFFGLVVVVPVLGHATWHLYRKLLPG